MTIRKKVAHALRRVEVDHRPLSYDGSLRDKQVAAAITALLEAAAEDGWHMRPDEATKEMVNAGPFTPAAYRTMLAAAPEFEWNGE